MFVAVVGNALALAAIVVVVDAITASPASVAAPHHVAAAASCPRSTAATRATVHKRHNTK